MNWTISKIFTEVAQACHEVAKSKGFYDREVVLSEQTENIHGEVSELWDAHREGKLNQPCNKPIPLTCMEEELADIIIRTLDTAAHRGVDIGRAVLVKFEYNKTRSYRHGGKIA